MGRRNRKGRNISGILLLDKPAGMTSNAALQTVKRLYNACKAGHTGSLDPLATGVLPLCFGEATKFSQFLLDADKRYLTTIRLGVITDSGDADGEVLEERAVPSLSKEKLQAILANYRGEITQVPSMFSAIKVDGQPLYKLARQGIEVERKSRQVTIHCLELVSWDETSITLDISCSKGTYVRSLAEDIGQDLGCGAHVTVLRRLGAGPFNAEQTITLEELEAMTPEARDQALTPLFGAVQDWPSVHITDVMASYVRQGQPVQVANAPTEGWVSIFSESDEHQDEFIGVGEIMDDGKVAPRRIVAH